MTTTMILEKQLGPRAGQGFRFPVPGCRLFDNIRRSLFATASAGSGHRMAAPPISPAVGREVAAIDSFAQFLSTQPDMPAEHRDRFLRRILRSCAEIRKEAS